jgi:hypothetical protein
MNVDDLVSLQAAAAAWGIPYQTAWNWAVNGLGRDRDKLPTRRLGRDLFVGADDLLQYMRRHGRFQTHLD